MDNLEIWNKVARPPESALKKILGGRLKNMTDISPQWRYKAMTEVFGPCGKGWSYTIEKLWTEQGVDGEVMAFAQVNLNAGPVSVPGIGGSKLIAKESNGLHNSDEAYKMAVTDALSVAMKMLGVGADIYMGMWDGSKYKDKVTEAIIKADVKPLNVSLKPDREEVIKRVYSSIVDCMTAEAFEDGLGAYMDVTDADEKVFLQSLMDKQTKKFIKDAKAFVDSLNVAQQA